MDTLVIIRVDSQVKVIVRMDSPVIVIVRVHNQFKATIRKHSLVEAVVKQESQLGLQNRQVLKVESRADNLHNRVELEEHTLVELACDYSQEEPYIHQASEVNTHKAAYNSTIHHNQLIPTVEPAT